LTFSISCYPIRKFAIEAILKDGINKGPA